MVTSKLPVNVSGNKICFILPARKLAEMDFLSVVPVGPELFVLSARVIGDNRVCGLQDVPAGAVILLQAHNERIRENLLEIQDIADIGAAELIN